MSLWLRAGYACLGTIANAVQALLYYRIGTQLFKMGKEGGKYAGTFSETMSWIETAWVAEIAIVQLALLLYVVYGPVRKERARARVAR